MKIRTLYLLGLIAVRKGTLKLGDLLTSLMGHYGHLQDKYLALLQTSPTPITQLWCYWLYMAGVRGLMWIPWSLYSFLRKQSTRAR